MAVKRRGKRWAVYVYNPATQKAEYRPPMHDTKTAAKDAEAALRVSRTASTRETLVQFGKRWPEQYRRESPSTMRHYRYAWGRLETHFAGRRMESIERREAREYALKVTPMERSAIRAIFNNWLSEQNNPPRNPFAALNIAGSKGRKNITALTEAEIERLGQISLDEYGPAVGPEIKAMIFVAAYTGIREGELFALRPEDIGADTLDVEWQLDQDGERRPKNKRRRQVILPAVARQTLHDFDWLERERVFLTPSRSKPFRVGSLRYWWDPIRRKFGRPDLDWHELRHAAATVLLERGATPWDVAIQLGHTDGGKLVMDLYGHPSEAGARDRIRAAFGTNPGQGDELAPVREGRSA